MQYPQMQYPPCPDRMTLPSIPTNSPTNPLQTVNHLNSTGSKSENVAGIKDDIQSASMLPITEGLQALDKSLDTWTKLLEAQVNELHHSFTTLRKVAEGFPPLQHKCTD